MKLDRGTAVAALLGGGIAAAAALGVAREGMLQDTFKSAVVALGALAAAMVLWWPGNARDNAVRWHPALLLPLLLCVYAIGSMVWSHTWNAGVEAVRWFLVALIACLALNVSRDERLQRILAWAVAAGGLVASIWVVLQFFFGLELFPQGARPGSTFNNRNFFAEFAVCTLPFFAFLIARERRRVEEIVLSALIGVVAVAICMTGARAALVALGALGVIAASKSLGSGLRRNDKATLGSGLRRNDKATLGSGLRRNDKASLGFGLRRNDKGASSRRRPGPSVFWLCSLAVVAVLGVIPTGDARIAAEGRGETAIARAFSRSASIASSDEATTMRMEMWAATAQSIAEHPLTGLGAGAWENEADFYAHNEFLQLVAEYGVVGWLFLVALAVWIAFQLREAGAWRGALLCSLLALFIVSGAGFPWHLATTCAIFGVCLGGLAASRSRELTMTRGTSIAAAAFIAIALAFAVYATWTASRAESRLARAARIALEIGGTSNPNDVRWSPAKSEMLRLVDEGMRLHPHERQMTPIVADELGRWGDWPNAIRIWEHLLRSRPNTVVLLTNVARGYIAIGRADLATLYLERARRIRPDASSVRAVDALLRQMSSSKG